MFSFNGVRAASLMQLSSCNLTASQIIFRMPLISSSKASFSYKTRAPEPKLETAQKFKEFKFDSFLKGGEKDYKVVDEWKNFERAATPEKFITKEEYSKIKFDPNIRHRLPEMPNSLVYRAINDLALPP